MNRKIATENQKFALQCYFFAIENEFEPRSREQLKKDIAKVKYEDEYKDIEAVLGAEATGAFWEQIRRFFLKLLT